jgi:hypothetical protein
MSRWNRLEEMEKRLPDISADEVRAELQFWRKQGKVSGSNDSDFTRNCLAFQAFWLWHAARSF